MRNLRALALKGMMWSALGRVSARIIELAFTLLLVRLLAPGDYGLMALAGVFTGVLGLFLDMGISPGIVQRRDLDDEYLSTAFWANLVSGAVLTLVAILGGELFIAAARNPAVRPVIAVLSLRFLIAGVAETQMVLLIREMKFQVITLRGIAASAAGGIVAVVLALRGAGVWALVAHLLVGAAVGTLLMWYATRWRPRRVFSWPKFVELWHFGIRVFGSELFRYLVRRADIFLVGRYLGTVLLGYYSLGLTLFVFPLTEVASIVNRVALPAFSRVQDEPARLRQGLLLATRYSALFSLPAIIGLNVLAPLVVLAAFGTKWLPAVPVIRVFTISSAVIASNIIWRTVLIGSGRPELRFRWSVVDAAVYMGAYTLGLRWGIVGVATGHVVATVLSFVVGFYIIRTIVDLRLTDFLRTLRPIVLASLVMAAVLAFGEAWLRGEGLAPAVRLLVLVAIGSLVYAGAMWVIGRDVVLGVLRSMRTAVARVPA